MRKILTRPCERGHLVADLYHCVNKGPFKALFVQLRLADTELAVTRYYREIEALSLVFRGSQNN